MKSPKKRSTIIDVASRAGVSIKTVSRVLNREARVRPATRDRVEAAIAELRYRPNTSARMLAGNKTYLVGLMYSANSSYVSSLQDGAIDACRDDHYDLLVYPCDYASEMFYDELEELVTTPRVDGLVLMPPVCDMPRVRRLLRDHAFPNVMVSRDAGSRAEWSVATNDREICARVVEHLTGLGHRRIAFVCGHGDHKAMQKREQGFLDGMAAAGLRVDDSLIAGGDNSFDSGIRAGTRLLGLAEPPSAVFCANDHMAAGVMQVAHNMGMRIPADVSIAGFDDLPIASQIWPQLTTVHQPLQAMGRQAVELLLNRVRGHTPANTRLVVESEIVVRRSTGPIR